MAKFYSYPGSRPALEREGFALPDIYAEEHNAQFGEFLESRRNSTSHLEVGLQAGEKIHFRDAAGEDRPAIVEGEERDPHSGKVDVYLRANDPMGSGSYKMTFEGSDARTLKASRTKRIHE